jgi:DNA-binding transcriptional regulator LsrR (DeoR family)
MPAILVGSGNTFSIEELQSLEDKGAVGNICLRFYNANGEEIKDALGSNRVFGLELERLKSIPMVVGIACGKRKRQPSWERCVVVGSMSWLLVTESLAMA